MMKFVKIFASLLLVLTLCTASTGKDKGKGIYMVGVSACFTDSLVCFTDIQFLEGVKLDKGGILYGRKDYSSQLDVYLEEGKGMKNRVCFVYFDEKKSKLEKVVKKMKDKYLDKGNVAIEQVGADFKFVKVEEE